MMFIRPPLLLMAVAAVAAAAFGAEDLTRITLPVTAVKAVADKPSRIYPGRVVPVAQVNVIPQVSGEILEVAFANGSMVKPGELLYRLDPVKYEAAVKNAEAKVAECTATLQYAELSYTRHQKLVETRAVSQDALDNALSTRDSARAALEAAKADLTSAQDDLTHCRITAPIAGKVGTTRFTTGNYLQKGQGTLVTLIQYEPIRVRFSVSNREFLEMFGGSTQRLRSEGILSLRLADGSELTEEGVLEYSENAADEQTDTIQIYALYPNSSNSLRPGGTVSVSLTTKKGVPRPAVPPTAILQDVQGPYVWVVGADGVAERRYIARGDIQGDWQFVEKGLKIGECIVADGGHKVRKGMRVVAAPEK
ncbi:MAG: efflux RND transporter periplasmic adaptor subunit [Kiritimatiellia bacterium]